MSSTLLLYAEFIIGLVSLGLAVISLRPMKRYYANSSVAKNDEFLVVIWLVLAIFGVTMVLYSIA